MIPPSMWLFVVEFARWTTPDSTTLEIGVCARTAEEAIPLAQAEARRAWQEDAAHLSVRRVTRGGGIHALAPAGPGGRA